MEKNKMLIYLSIASFGVMGIYLTFISGNINKYDSQTTAYKIELNENYDFDEGTKYSPTYYYKVNGKNYECESIASNSVPNESKNKVYYDSKNPKKCKTEYEKSSSITAGIVFLMFTVLIIVLTVKYPPSNKNEANQNNQVNNIDIEKQNQINENIEKTEVIIKKAQLIYKRIILGIIILILFVINLFFIPIFKQTIVSKDFIKTTATYVDKKENTKDSIFNDYIYTFKDKQGNEQEIIISLPKDETPEDKIYLKYNQNNPKDFYKKSEIMDKSEFIWFIVRIIVMILLIILFFNKKLLSKIHITASKN